MRCGFVDAWRPGKPADTAARRPGVDALAVAVGPASWAAPGALWPALVTAIDALQLAVAPPRPWPLRRRAPREYRTANGRPSWRP
ncbi:hypothetical protein GCM10010254_49290 [Streptomyces chromofuscus]|nr:hypothetical protein GCM10010254_49290 [Streptomyces chromofuscus]